MLQKAEDKKPDGQLQKILSTLTSNYDSYARISDVNLTLSSYHLTKSQISRILRVLEAFGFVKRHKGLIIFLRGRDDV